MGVVYYFLFSAGLALSRLSAEASFKNDGFGYAKCGIYEGNCNMAVPNVFTPTKGMLIDLAYHKHKGLRIKMIVCGGYTTRYTCTEFGIRNIPGARVLQILFTERVRSHQSV